MQTVRDRYVISHFSLRYQSIMYWNNEFQSKNSRHTSVGKLSLLQEVTGEIHISVNDRTILTSIQAQYSNEVNLPKILIKSRCNFLLCYTYISQLKLGICTLKIDTVINKSIHTKFIKFILQWRCYKIPSSSCNPIVISQSKWQGQLSLK